MRGEFIVDFDSFWVAKHEPWVGGYIVVYDDNYTSFSPEKAFDEGYTLKGAAI
jgi:hypothetical protein